MCILTNTPHTEYLSCNSKTYICKNARPNNIEKHIFRDRQSICKILELSKRFDSSSYLKFVKTFLHAIQIEITLYKKPKL